MTHDEFIERLSQINPTIKITSTFISTKHKVNCECTICHHRWQATGANLLYNKNGCQICQINKKAEQLRTPRDILEPKIFNLTEGKIILIDYIKHGIRLHCSVCGCDFEKPITNFLQFPTCPICSGRQCVDGINDLWTTNPSLAQMLLRLEDGHKYTVCQGNQKLDWLCACGYIVNKSIYQVKKFGIRCPMCGDGWSFGSKFTFRLLTQLHVEFENEKTFLWSCNKIYDFYMPNLNCIIEVDGEQHYNHTFASVGGDTYEEIHENDIFKEKLAKENGIEYYIHINATTPTLKHMSKSILNSEFKNIVDLSNVDWNDCGVFAQKSMLYEICEMWNDGMKYRDIRNKLKISNPTIKKYLRYGDELGFCKYSHEISIIRNKSSAVQCITTGEIFEQMKQAEEKYETQHISNCCRGISQYAGCLPSGEKLQWRYVENNLITGESV